MDIGALGKLKSKNIIIISSHRSGSSLFSGMMNLELKNSAPSNDGDAYNIIGYNEDLDILKLSEYFLESHNCSWISPPEFVSESQRKKFHDKYKSLLKKKSNIKVIKEPRLLNIIPLIDVDLSEYTIFLVKRNEVDVKLSIQRRNGFNSRAIDLYIERCKLDYMYFENKYKCIEIKYELLADSQYIKEIFKNKLSVEGDKAIELIRNKNEIYGKQLWQSIKNDLAGLNLKKISINAINRRLIKYSKLLKAILMNR